MTPHRLPSTMIGLATVEPTYGFADRSRSACRRPVRTVDPGRASGPIHLRRRQGIIDVPAGPDRDGDLVDLFRGPDQDNSWRVVLESHHGGNGEERGRDLLGDGR